MLDDLKLIHERDPDDSLGIAERQWQQLNEEYSIDIDASDIENIVWSGMGGSALAALVSASWPGYKVPFEVVRNYDIPKYVSNKTLFIACSYSGNTEETLTALDKAIEAQAKVCIIASGGKLINQAKDQSIPYIAVPVISQPRYALLYMFKALVTILAVCGQIAGESVLSDLSSASKFLAETAKDWQATMPTSNNFAKQIATEAAGKSVVIYAGPKLAPAAYKWKISFNENAKQIAWWNQYPEFNHNEFIGWSEQPPLKPYLVVDLRSSYENPRVIKRFELSAKLLSGKRPEPVVVNAKGNSLIEHILYAVMLGDFASIYSAILSGVNPSPVDLVVKFKQELAL